MLKSNPYSLMVSTHTQQPPFYGPIQIKLCKPAPPVKNWQILSVQSLWPAGVLLNSVIYTVSVPSGHNKLETTINFLSQKLAISGIDTLSLDPSIKIYTDAILQIKLICPYICHHSVLLYVHVYELCSHSCV